MNRLWGSISNDGLSIYDEMFMIICIGCNAMKIYQFIEYNAKKIIHIMQCIQCHTLHVTGL